jgi:hypothetical protein
VVAVHDNRGEVDLAIGQSMEAAVIEVSLVQPIDLPLVATRVSQRGVNALLAATSAQ